MKSWLAIWFKLNIEIKCLMAYEGDDFLDCDDRPSDDNGDDE